MCYRSETFCNFDENREYAFSLDALLSRSAWLYRGSLMFDAMCRSDARTFYRHVFDWYTLLIRSSSLARAACLYCKL